MPKPHVHIVKRRGHREVYDDHKVYGSCYAACLNAHCKKETSEELCTKVAAEIDAWVDNQREVTSQQIFEKMATIMKKFDDEAAFMYATHRDIS